MALAAIASKAGAAVLNLVANIKLDPHNAHNEKLWKDYDYAQARYWTVNDGVNPANEALNLYYFMSATDRTGAKVQNFDIDMMFKDENGFRAVTEQEIKKKLAKNPQTGVTESTFNIAPTTSFFNSAVVKEAVNGMFKPAIVPGEIKKVSMFNILGVLLLIGSAIAAIVYFAKGKGVKYGVLIAPLLFSVLMACSQGSNNGIQQKPADWNASAGVTRILNKPLTFPSDSFFVATRARVKKVADSLSGKFVPYVGAVDNVDLSSYGITALYLNGSQSNLTGASGLTIANVGAVFGSSALSPGNNMSLLKVSSLDTITVGTSTYPLVFKGSFIRSTGFNVNGSFSLVGNATITGSVSASSNITTSGSLAATGFVSAVSATITNNVGAGSLSITNNGTIGANLSVGNNLSVVGNTNMAGDLAVDDITSSGVVSANVLSATNFFQSKYFAFAENGDNVGSTVGDTAYYFVNGKDVTLYGRATTESGGDGLCKIGVLLPFSLESMSGVINVSGSAEKSTHDFISSVSGAILHFNEISISFITDFSASFVVNYVIHFRKQ